MHKWRLSKKTAAVLLSSAIVVSGVPSTAFAADVDAYEEVTVFEEDAQETAPALEEELQEAEISAQDVETADPFISGEELFSASDEAEEPELFGDTAASGEYQYVYAGLSWAEYWEAEGVLAAGSSVSSQEADANGEFDKGAFDTVTRATRNHGLHRGSFQCNAIIYGESGKTYPISYWADGSTIVLTDGSTVAFNKGDITLADGSTDSMDHYIVTGIKYVPVKVKTEDYADFCKLYQVVEKDGVLAGGYTENNLVSYTAAADVTENTNGLKTAVKNADGSFHFSARAAGTDSGLKDTALKTAEGVTVEVKDANGSYGEFLRVDLNGNYGGLGAAMQAVKWTYYGNDSTYSNPLAVYGTKFASDNWMHKAMGVQLGLTDSVRCQLPAGTDGTGYWALTVYALGYADYTVKVQATEANIVKPSAEEVDTTKMEAVIAQAKALKESSYTPDSWEKMKLELEECEEMLANISRYNQAGVDEQITHLESAIKDLAAVQFKFAKASATIYTKGTTTVTLKLTKNVSGKITYSTSNKKVATVSSKGVVTAKKTGTVTITAKSGNYKATCKITVKNPSLKLAKTSASVKKGKTVTVKATATPAGKVTYKTANKKIATVTSKGVVKGISRGKTTITVTCNGVSKKFTVTVK
ncbi:MAG: penicillin-binding Tp47 domain C-containing protein [Eubacteriales bacterium]|nr:penicillin-binding Tp47 domain C-containing protein [Eubacteriales bacterium]